MFHNSVHSWVPVGPLVSGKPNVPETYGSDNPEFRRFGIPEP